MLQLLFLYLNPHAFHRDPSGLAFPPLWAYLETHCLIYNNCLIGFSSAPWIHELIPCPKAWLNAFILLLVSHLSDFGLLVPSCSLGPRSSLMIPGSSNASGVLYNPVLLPPTGLIILWCEYFTFSTRRKCHEGHMSLSYHHGHSRSQNGILQCPFPVSASWMKSHPYL